MKHARQQLLRSLRHIVYKETYFGVFTLHLRCKNILAHLSYTPLGLTNKPVPADHIYRYRSYRRLRCSKQQIRNIRPVSNKSWSRRKHPYIPTDRLPSGRTSRSKRVFCMKVDDNLVRATRGGGGGEEPYFAQANTEHPKIVGTAFCLYSVATRFVSSAGENLCMGRIGDITAIAQASRARPQHVVGQQRKRGTTSCSDSTSPIGSHARTWNGNCTSRACRPAARWRRWTSSSRPSASRWPRRGRRWAWR